MGTRLKQKVCGWLWYGVAKYNEWSVREPDINVRQHTMTRCTANLQCSQVTTWSIGLWAEGTGSFEDCWTVLPHCSLSITWNTLWVILVLLGSKMFTNDADCLVTKVCALFIEAVLGLKRSQSPDICYKQIVITIVKILLPCLTVYIVPG